MCAICHHALLRRISPHFLMHMKTKSTTYSQRLHDMLVHNLIYSSLKVITADISSRKEIRGCNGRGSDLYFHAQSLKSSRYYFQVNVVRSNDQSLALDSPKM